MPTAQQTKEDVMGKINAIIAALNSYPALQTTNTQLSFSASANPIDLLVDFFKTTMGYDYVIEKVSEYVAVALPALELAVKGVLLSNIRVMLSCSINPFITENMIKNGVVFNINEIDLLNIFNYSPLNKNVDNPGKYYYFGCEPEDGIEILDDLKNTRDFNAFLWYSKNSPGERIAWRRETDVSKPITLSQTGKQVKSNGIVTVEFNGRASGLTNAEGDGFLVQEPIDNCVHVFIGNCAPEVRGSYAAEIVECTRKIKKFEDLAQESSEYKNKVIEYRNKANTEAINRGDTTEEINKIKTDAENDLFTLKRLDGAIIGVDIVSKQPGKNISDIFPDGTVELNSIHQTIVIADVIMNTNEVKEKEYKVECMRNTVDKEYYPAINNYYYKRFLFEWNSDFIMSMKIFDEKVVSAQLIDALTNCLKFTGGIVTITPQMQFAQAQIRNLVTKIIQSDDGEVSDCFFSFTNDTYNDMLNEVELNRVNLTTTNGSNANAIPSTETVMEALNTLSHDATKEELKSAISGSIYAATSAATPNEYGKDGNLSLDFGINLTIIDQLIHNLVYVIVLTIMQPKIYVMLMMNLKLLGNEPNFDLKKFIQQFKDLISQLVKTIRDHVLEYFKNLLMEILQELVKTLAVKLTLEQYQYYVTLITHCINCLKIHRNQFDWIQDDVNYADITEANQLENQEC